jgi:hypothetical protein
VSEAGNAVLALDRTRLPRRLAALTMRNAEAPMDATNPYQPPKTSALSTTEQKFAVRLLSFRDQPLTLWKLYRSQAKQLAILFLVFGLGVVYFGWINLGIGVYMLLGCLAGVLLRDFGIFRAQKKVWQMQTKVLDWGKVERMAAGELLDQ